MASKFLKPSSRSKKAKQNLCMQTQAEPHNSYTILWWRWWILDGEIVSMSILFSKLLCKSHDVWCHVSCWSTQSSECCYPEYFECPALYITFSIYCQQHDVLRGLTCICIWIEIMSFHVQVQVLSIKFLSYHSLSFWNMFNVQTVVEYEHHCLCKELKRFASW